MLTIRNGRFIKDFYGDKDDIELIHLGNYLHSFVKADDVRVIREDLEIFSFGGWL